MNLTFTVQNSNETCSIQVNALPTSVTCSLSANTTSSASLTISYRGSNGSGFKNSPPLVFTTGPGLPTSSLQAIVDPIDMSSGKTTMGFCMTSPESLSGIATTIATLSGTGFIGNQVVSTSSFSMAPGLLACPNKIGYTLNYRLAWSSNYTFSISVNVNGQNFTDSINWTTPAAPILAGLIPTLGAITNLTSTGYTVVVLNYDPTFTWSVNASLGSASINSSGLITVSGLSPNQLSVLTVSSSRSGYSNGSASISTTTIASVPLPALLSSFQNFGTPVPGRNLGFTLSMSNVTTATIVATNGVTTLTGALGQGPSGDNWIYVTSGTPGGVAGYTGSGYSILRDSGKLQRCHQCNQFSWREHSISNRIVLYCGSTSARDAFESNNVCKYFF